MEDVKEALAGDGGRRLEAGEFEEGRSEVAGVDDVIDDAAGLDVFAVADGQRNVEAFFLNLGLDTRERHAVVRGDDDESVVEFADAFQRCQGAAEVLVV